MTSSETLALEVSTIPVGVTISDGTNSFTATSGNTTVDITAWTWNTLTVTGATNSDQDFALTYSAIATESGNGDTTITTDTMNVQLSAVADQPTLTVPATIIVDEDTRSAAFAILSSLTDTDGSETLLLTVRNVPVGATLTDGVQTFVASSGNTTVDVTAWALSSLQITPASDTGQDFVLSVMATATEAKNSHQAHRTDFISVTVNAIADQPALTVPATIAITEDNQSLPFTISASLTDTDGSESLTIAITDVPEGVTVSDGTNGFTGSLGNTTVNVTGWDLGHLTVAPPSNSDQDFTLTVTATATEAENSDQNTRTNAMNVQVTAVADQPTLTVPSLITLDEDTQSTTFAIGSALTDTDGSETLLLEVSDIPAGTTLTDGTNSFTATTGNTSVDITNWTHSNIQLTPARDSDEDFTLTVTATSTELANSDQAVNIDTIDVEVTAVADLPNLTVPATVTVDEDSQSASLAINVALNDTDGSETLKLEILNVPVGTTLTDGTHTFIATTGDTTVDVTTWVLSGMTLTPPADSDVDFTLTVMATVQEGENLDQVTRTDEIDVVVNAVADQPSLTVPSTITVNEDTSSAPFTVSSAPTDTDGSESVMLEIGAIPAGTTITDGTNTFTASLGNTTVNVTTWNWSNLSVTPPADNGADFTLTVTSTATEAASSDQNTKIDSIVVEVNAVADQPNLTVPSTLAVDEDTNSAAFTVSSTLNDTDGSETLAVQVSDIPEGATLTDGFHTFTGSTGNTQIDVTSWTLTNLSITPSADSDVDFTLTVTATSTESDNGHQSTRMDTIDVEVTAVADQPTLTVPSTITVNEDTQSATFSISSLSTDVDGSESVAMWIGDLPIGARLTDGTNTVIASVGFTDVDVTNWDLNALSITPPADSDADFVLSVTSTATEAANADTNTRLDSINVSVNAVADQPTLTVPATIFVDEDTQSTVFTVLPAVQDTDGSESLTLEISDVPVGAQLTDGTNLFVATAGNTTADVSGWNLNALRLTASENSDVDFTLTVTATTTEASNGDQNSRTETIDVTVNAVADQPTLTVPSSVVVDEDTQSGTFAVSAALTDTDGSESLNLEAGSLPIGATISDGINTFTATAGSTTVDITNWNLTSLTIAPPANSDANFAIGITATSAEAANSDQATKVDSISVVVSAVADAPTLIVPSTVNVNEDTQSGTFAIDAFLADASESLIVEIGDIPLGTTLSDGTNNFMATTGATNVDISTWNATNLSITTASNSDVDFTLTVTATATDGGDSAVTTDTIDVVVEAVADQPTLTVPSTVNVDEDMQSAAFTISASLTDTDGSESLQLMIGDVPVGATVTDAPTRLPHRRET